MAQASVSDRIFLLTGATGNIGGSICRELIARGEHVRALIRNPAKARVDAAVEICRGDILELPSLDRFFQTPEGTKVYVIHCAGIVTLDPDFNQTVHDVNITGTQYIIDRCKEHKVEKLIYVSSSSAIPELPGDQPMTEVDRFDPDAVIGYYSKTKAAAAQLVLDAVKQYDLDASVVFPVGIFGPNDYALGAVTQNMINLIKGKLPCAVEGTFNCADVRDVSDAIITCCFKGRKGEGYILGSELMTVRQLFDAVAEAANVKKVKITLPAGLVRFGAGIAEAAAKLMKKPPVVSRFMVYNLVRNNRYNSDKAVKELNYHTRPMEETVRDEIAWLKEEKLI